MLLMLEFIEMKITSYDDWNSHIKLVYQNAHKLAQERNADIEVVAGTEFTASFSPAKDVYNAGEAVMVQWGVNGSYFTKDSRVRITMSDNYGRSFEYVLAESVPAREGNCNVELPDVNVGDVDVDFITAVRSMPGGIIRVEEIGGVAYTLTAISPERGGCFNITGGTGIDKMKGEAGDVNIVYDLLGREVYNPCGGVYIVNGKKFIVR